jgi:hypothetical protein
LAQYVQCPGSTEGSIDNAGELASCLLNVSETFIGQATAAALGEATTYPSHALYKGALKCQGTIGKGFSKILKTAVKVRTACQALDEVAGTTDYVLTAGGCGGAHGDPEGAVAAAVSALKLSIDTACANLTAPDAAIAELNMCGSNATSIKSCAVDKAISNTTAGLIAALYELPGECPAAGRIVINGAYGASKQTNTRLDSGFTGLAHNVDVVDGSNGGVLLQNCDPNCENCDVRIDASQGYCRCDNNSTIECDAGAEVADVDDCGGNICHCMFGPPLPLNAGLSPVCAVNRFAANFTGGTTTVGSYSVGTRTNTFVYGGLSQVRPCPTCVGDITPNDGNKQGQCQYASEDPPVGSCDVNARGADNFGDTSFDCLPQDIPIGTLKLALSFTDGNAGFTAALTTASGFCGSGTCHCSQCTGDSAVGCATNTDCSVLGAGTCGVNFGGTDNPKQNSCTAGPADCTNLNSKDPAMGICQGGPNDQYCDGALRGNGGGILTCTSQAGCDTYDSICDGGECGNCVAGMPNAQRSCFLPTISAKGVGGIFNSDGVTAFCSARTSSPTVNSAGGLPGPGRVKLDFDFDIKCDDNSTSFLFPGGSNCP